MKIGTITAKLLRLSLTAISMIVVVNTTNAQNPFEDAIKQLSSDNVRGYIQPFVNSVGANLNSGLSHSADVSGLGLSVKVEFVGMGTLIGDAEKMYNAVAPAPFDQTPVQTATVYGGLGAVASGPGGTQYYFQNGEVKTSMVPLAVPQVTIGNVFGTRAMIRYVPIPKIGEFPEVTFFGIGVQHSISRYLPGTPVDIAASLFYQKVSIGDIMEEKAISFGAQASKSFSVVTVYGGMQYESSNMSLHYTYVSTGSNISLDIDGENKFRVTGGLALNLVILNLFADINVGKVTVASGGIGFGF